MAELGFEIQHTDVGANVALPELAAAALKSR
jgi:hypothetical protein